MYEFCPIYFDRYCILNMYIYKKKIFFVMYLFAIYLNKILSKSYDNLQLLSLLGFSKPNKADKT